MPYSIATPLSENKYDRKVLTAQIFRVSVLMVLQIAINNTNYCVGFIVVYINAYIAGLSGFPLDLMNHTLFDGIEVSYYLSCWSRIHYLRSEIPLCTVNHLNTIE